MPIHEAAELIVQSGVLSEGRDVFLLDMGSLVLVSDLAEQMVRLAGLSVRYAANPTGDIEIVVTGERPGEKMFEEPIYDANPTSPTRHPKILRAFGKQGAQLSVSLQLEQLRQAQHVRDEERAQKILSGLNTEAETTASAAG